MQLSNEINCEIYIWKDDVAMGTFTRERLQISWMTSTRGLYLAEGGSFN